MKVRSEMPFPLGPHDIISKEAAMEMMNQKFPATNERHQQIGDAKVIDVDWRNNQEVYLTIEMEIPDGLLG